MLLIISHHASMCRIRVVRLWLWNLIWWLYKMMMVVMVMVVIVMMMVCADSIISSGVDIHLIKTKFRHGIT